MIRRISRAVLSILVPAAAVVTPAWSQDARPAFAVLPFANGGSYGQDKEIFAALERGIPATLIAELGRNPSLRVVERTETQRLLGQTDRDPLGRVDAATAARIGQQVGARYAVMGTFIDYYGKFRIDARIVDVASGEILKVVQAGPADRQELYGLVRQIADGVVTHAGIPTSQDAGRARSVPTEALTAFSRALLYHDRGDTARAAEFYQQALSLLPDYPEAREGLSKIRS